MPICSPRAGRRLAPIVLAAALLTACASPPVPPPAAPLAPPALSAAPTTARLAAGTVSGLVAAWMDGEFRPIAGAKIRVSGEGATSPVVSGPDGRYTFTALAPGSHTLRVEAEGFDATTTRVTLDPVQGVPRANVVLVPAGYALAQVAPFDANVSGVVTDPRGAALPGATVHVVNNCANGGAGSNFFVTTDANGFYTATIPAVAVSAASPGVVQASATGLSPGGLRLDNLNFTSGFLTGPAIVLSPQMDTFEAPGTPTITGSSFVAPGGLASVTATRLSSRADEFYIEVTSGGRIYTVLPNTVSTGTVTFQAPFTLPSSTFTARIVPFGKPAGASPASPAFTSQYLQADFDADLSYSVNAALVDTTTGALDLNGLLFTAGDTAEYTITLTNANPVISQDVRLEGTVPVGVAIASASAGGTALAAGGITQPDAGGRFAVQGITVPAGGTPVPVAIRFLAPTSLATGSGFQVTSPAVRMPSSALTKAVAPATPAALTVQSVDAANFTVTKGFVDDGTAGNGIGVVRLVLTATGSGAIGAFDVTDKTLTDQAAGAAAATVIGSVAQPAQGTPGGYTPGERLDLSVDGGATTSVMIFSSSTDLEILLGQINTTAGLQGLLTATRTADDKIRIARTVQGSTRTVEILGTSSAGLLAKLGLSAGLVAGTDGILASFANATASQAGGTVWSIVPTTNTQNADGSVSVAFSLTPPAAYALGDGPTAPITVTYQVVKTGANLGLGGGTLGTGFGARVISTNLVAPYTDATKDVAVGASVADPAAIVGL